MKTLLVLFTSSLLSADLSSMRTLYQAAPQSEQKALELLQLADKNISANVVYRGYKGAATILMAKYATYPLAKWNRFNEGKALLESAISTEPMNPELRYLRLTIQTNAPKMLGYDDDIEKDKLFLKTRLDQIPDKELQKIVRAYINRV